jgi:hypothetical protein
MIPVIDDSAAGPKTDTAELRRERLAVSLEEQFHICRKETDVWLARNRTDEGYFYSHKLDGLIKLVRVNAQLASVIARIDAAKNRNSKTQ